MHSCRRRPLLPTTNALEIMNGEWLPRHRTSRHALSALLTGMPATKSLRDSTPRRRSRAVHVSRSAGADGETAVARGGDEGVRTQIADGKSQVGAGSWGSDPLRLAESAPSPRGAGHWGMVVVGRRGRWSGAGGPAREGRMCLRGLEQNFFAKARDGCRGSRKCACKGRFQHAAKRRATREIRREKRAMMVGVCSCCREPVMRIVLMDQVESGIRSRIPEH